MTTTEELAAMRTSDLLAQLRTDFEALKEASARLAPYAAVGAAVVDHWPAVKRELQGGRQSWRKGARDALDALAPLVDRAEQAPLT